MPIYNSLCTWQAGCERGRECPFCHLSHKFRMCKGKLLASKFRLRTTRSIPRGTLWLIMKESRLKTIHLMSFVP